jgi:hypothetical protein
MVVWCLAAASAPAHAAVPDGFLGIVADRAATDGTVSIDRQARWMRRAGATAIGLTFVWAHAQPTRDGPLRWEAIDAQVRAAARWRLAIHPVIITAPAWARLDPSREFSPPADADAYAAFCAELVRRYGPGGTFWAQNPGLPALPIRSWQVWNEPVGGVGDATPSVFWPDSSPLQTRYVPLLRAASAAIHDADAGAQVVLAALVGRSWQTLQLIYDTGARGTFDAVALHPYTAKPQNVVRIVRSVRATMRRNGDGALPIQITELGWPAFDAADVRALGEAKAARAQAWWLGETFSRLTAQRRALNLQLLLWYTWVGRDRSGQDAFDHSGLVQLRADGRLVAKPALAAFTKIARR